MDVRMLLDGRILVTDCKGILRVDYTRSSKVIGGSEIARIHKFTDEGDMDNTVLVAGRIDGGLVTCNPNNSIVEIWSWDQPNVPK